MTIDSRALSDADLVSSLRKLVAREREDLVNVLMHLAELDERALAIKAGFPSLFAYCVKELRYSEGEAARRIQVARSAMRYPAIYRSLSRGRLSLTAVSLLSPHLTTENCHRMLLEAMGRSTREIEAMLAIMVGKSAPKDRIQVQAIVAPFPQMAGGGANPRLRLSLVPGAAIIDPLHGGSASVSAGAPVESGSCGASTPGNTDSAAGAAAPQPAVEKGVGLRVQFSFSADESVLKDVERAKELLAHKYPRATLAEVVGEALRALLARLDPGSRRRPRRRERPKEAGCQSDKLPSHVQSARRIPGWVKDDVWRRDAGACAFVSQDGRRCGSRYALQFDHVVPWAKGGRSDDPANIRVLCRAHNLLEAKREFGDGVVETAIAAARVRRGVSDASRRADVSVGELRAAPAHVASPGAGDAYGFF